MDATPSLLFTTKVEILSIFFLTIGNNLAPKKLKKGGQSSQKKSQGLPNQPKKIELPRLFSKQPNYAYLTALHSNGKKSEVKQKNGRT